ncbi:MAG: hypothetical protein JWP87_5756 [Labilithrix sp.]|nr:hypothetical protein [Labilithrix sp.]
MSKTLHRGRSPVFFAVAVVATTLAACGSESGREAYEDVGPGAATGGGPNGDGKGSTTFGTDPAGSAGSGGDGKGCGPDANDQAGCPCTTPGELRSCYAGPPSTRGVGLCQNGQQTCTTKDELGGAWSACTGSVIPAAEDCTGTSDRNCDGNIGCADPSCATHPSCQPACKAGDTKPCYTGPPGTSTKGVCKAGVQSCVNGKWDPACNGQVLPSAEACTDGLDNDCNGTADCADSACAAAPSCCTPNPAGVDGTIYANSADALYRVSPTTFAVTKIGNFNAGESMTDVAVTPAGVVYGISFTTLYAVNKTTGAATAIAAVGGNGNNSLTFLPSGDLLASDSNGDAKRINPSTGAVTYVGNYGAYTSSGDLVAIASGQMFGTAPGPSSDLLVKVSTSTGVATTVGATGRSSVWGLAYAGARVIGFTTAGEIVKIDPVTATTTLLATTSVSFWGAGQSPLVIASGCP